MRQWMIPTLCLMGIISATGIYSAPPLLPVVEAEYHVYNIDKPNNGSGPMWCRGSTCLVRHGKDVFASGLELIPKQKPLNNVRWTLFKLGDKGPQLLQVDPTGRPVR